jgi:hypothetical protein
MRRSLALAGAAAALLLASFPAGAQAIEPTVCKVEIGLLADMPLEGGNPHFYAVDNETGFCRHNGETRVVSVDMAGTLNGLCTWPAPLIDADIDHLEILADSDGEEILRSYDAGMSWFGTPIGDFVAPSTDGQTELNGTATISSTEPSWNALYDSYTFWQDAIHARVFDKWCHGMEVELVFEVGPVIP